MLDIVFQTVPEPIDNTSILLMCFAGNITIFAFGYPYIFRAINNLSIISSVLCNRVKNNHFIKLYSCFLIIAFLLNALSLFFSKSIGWSISLVVFLLIHICYIMGLYYFIENRLITPFNAIINKNIHKANSTLKNLSEFENDIILLFDIIYYLEKNSFKESELPKYFEWLIDATVLKFKNFDIEKFDDFFYIIIPEDNKKFFFILLEIQLLNQWAVNEKKIILLDYINLFYSWIQWYGIKTPKNFNNIAYPLLQSIQTTEELSNNYKKQNLIKYIQSNILQFIKFSILYRINNNFFSTNEIYQIVELLYYCLSNKLEIKQNEKYEPCFHIVSKMIDNNFSESHYHDMIDKISKHHDYSWGNNNIYHDICCFHINVMAYFILKNQYQMLKSYMYYEEPPNRTCQYTKPQIPNSINSIILKFIGNDSVFQNTQTFLSNVSSFKYKFYILFLLINYSKVFYDNYSNMLKELDKDNFNYNWINDRIKSHSEFSLEVSSVYFDVLTSFLVIENYQKMFKYFKLEIELHNIFSISEDNLIFISTILNKVITKIKKARELLLQEKISDIVKKEFSFQLQKELNVKSIEELLNQKLCIVIENIRKLKFSCNDTSKLEIKNLILYQQTFNKEKFLLEQQYKTIICYNSEPMNNFYNRLLNLLIYSCKEVTNIKDFPVQLDNYEIISTIFSKNSFLEFGFSEENLKCKATLVNGKLEENSSHAEIKSIIINEQEIFISKNNWHFRSVSNNQINNPVMLLIDSSKLNISIEDGQPIQFKDIKNGEIEIHDNTQIIVKVPQNKELGYYITKRDNINSNNLIKTI